MDNIQTGLMVSVVGITITFIALFIFIGVIILLQKLFPPKPETSEPEKENPQTPLLVSVTQEENMEADVAALAAAIFLQNRRSAQLGASLLSGPGPYKTSKQFPTR